MAEEAIGLCNKIIVGKLSVVFEDSMEHGFSSEEMGTLAGVLRHAPGTNKSAWREKIDGEMVRSAWAWIERDEECLWERRDIG